MKPRRLTIDQIQLFITKGAILFPSVRKQYEQQLYSLYNHQKVQLTTETIFNWIEQRYKPTYDEDNNKTDYMGF